MIFKKREKKEKTPKEILSSFSKLEEKIDKLEGIVEGFRKESEETFQKIGIIRFNPFSNTGGDQSFSLALLNGKDNGVVITSFYSREGSSVYAKPIKNGKSSYILSEEEKKAIEEAMNKNITNEVDLKKKNGRKKTK